MGGEKTWVVLSYIYMCVCVCVCVCVLYRLIPPLVYADCTPYSDTF